VNLSIQELTTERLQLIPPNQVFGGNQLNRLKFGFFSKQSTTPIGYELADDL
jgi:hypothetical protein